MLSLAAPLLAERVAARLAGFAGLTGIPFGNILGPLVVWLIKKDQSWFVNEQGKEAMNFQISLTIYAIVAAILRPSECHAAPASIGPVARE